MEKEHIVLDRETYDKLMIESDSLKKVIKGLQDKSNYFFHTRTIGTSIYCIGETKAMKKLKQKHEDELYSYKNQVSNQREEVRKYKEEVKELKEKNSKALEAVEQLMEDNLMINRTLDKNWWHYLAYSLFLVLSITINLYQYYTK